MFLDREELLQRIEEGKITISSFKAKNLKESSYDLNIAGDYVHELLRTVHGEPFYEIVGFGRENELLLEKDKLYLIRANIVYAPGYIGMISTRSSWARRGLDITRGNFLIELDTKSNIVLTVTVKEPLILSKKDSLGSLFIIEA